MATAHAKATSPTPTAIQHQSEIHSVVSGTGVCRNHQTGEVQIPEAAETRAIAARSADETAGVSADVNSALKAEYDELLLAKIQACRKEYTAGLQLETPTRRRVGVCHV